MKCAVALLNDLATARPHHATHNTHTHTHIYNTHTNTVKRGNTTHARTPNFKHCQLAKLLRSLGALQTTWLPLLLLLLLLGSRLALSSSGSDSGFRPSCCCFCPHRIQRCKYVQTSLQFVLESDHSCAVAVSIVVMCSCRNAL